MLLGYLSNNKNSLRKNEIDTSRISFVLETTFSYTQANDKYRLQLN